MSYYRYIYKNGKYLKKGDYVRSQYLPYKDFVGKVIKVEGTIIKIKLLKGGSAIRTKIDRVNKIGLEDIL